MQSGGQVEHVRLSRAGWIAKGLAACGLMLAGTLVQGQQDAHRDAPVTDATEGEKVLDRVIAVVNNQVILASDLEMEVRAAQLLPASGGGDAQPREALQRLTTRTLIEQQALQEDPQGMDVTAKELDDNLMELRQNLPACQRRDCRSASGWKAYLATLDLTPERLATYWSDRMAVLRFIERRFRPGVRISPEEIEKYYRETLVPGYVKSQDAPALKKVAPRIEEILLQQQINTLFNDWVKSLQEQGQVEILDASLRPEKHGGTAVGPDGGMK